MAICWRESAPSCSRTHSARSTRRTGPGSETFLSRPRERRLTREVLQLRQILASTGSIEWAQQSAVAFAEAAKREFDERAFAGVPAGPDLEWLRKSVDFIVQRNA